MLKAAANDLSLTTLRTAANGNYAVLRTNRRFGYTAFSVAAAKAWNVYLQTSRLLPVQRTLSNVAWRPGFSKGPMTDFHTILLLQLFYQYFYYYHYHNHYHYRYHHFMLCAIDLYMYCRSRNTYDCSHLHLQWPSDCSDSSLKLPLLIKSTRSLTGKLVYTKVIVF